MKSLLPVEQIRAQFPILNENPHGKPLVYLDSAATSQKPRFVLQRLQAYYEHENANVYRGVYTLSARATEAYEQARAHVAAFIHAPAPEEVIFVRGTTEAINLVADRWGRENLQPGDEVVVTPLEHHSNLVPWQHICAERGATLRYAELAEDGSLPVENVAAVVGPRTKLVAVAHISNVLGTILPVREIAELAHQNGALCLIDGAQAVPHLPVDVQQIGCDFYAFSGHKMLGPTGIGCLWAKRSILDAMDPWLYGGEMISRVTRVSSTFKESPYKFEGGTPNIAGAVGLDAALTFLEQVGMERITEHESALTEYALSRLSEIKGLQWYGPKERGGIVTFNLEGIHPHDVATVLDNEDICVRAGHHCAQPLMSWLSCTATVRASFYLYNTFEEVDALCAGLLKAKEFFHHAVV